MIMKIAFVVPYVPNKIRTRPFNLISYLSKLGHEVTLFTVGSGEPDLADVEYLRTICRQVFFQVQPTWQSLLNCVSALPTHKPLQTVYSWNQKLAIELKSQIGTNGNAGFDVIHVEHLRGSEYGVFLKSVFPNVPIVWDSVDCISHLFEQASKQSGGAFGKLVTRFELGRTREAEGRLLSQFDSVLVTSTTDRNALINLSPGGGWTAPVTVLPNGVDLDYFQPNESVQREPQTMVFSGKMSYHANISMVKYLMEEVMPKVWAQCRETRLVIVGKDPPAHIKSLASDSRIIVTGTVSDIRPYLWAATLAVVPLVYGAGIQNKILEAMATRTPVVATSKAISALQALPGRDILVADTPDAFASAILRLMGDHAIQDGVGSAGLQYVRQYHDWAHIAGQLSAEYMKLVSSRKK